MLTFDGSGLKRGATFSEIGLIRGMASLKGDNLLVFYYISASEICLDKRVDLWWEWPYKSVDLWWEWPYKRVTFSGSGLIKIVGHWWKWPYKKGGLRIRGLIFGGSGLKRGLIFRGSGLKRVDLWWEGPQKRDDLWWDWPYKRGNYCTNKEIDLP